MRTPKEIAAQMFGIQSGEGLAAGLLLLHSFFIGVAVSFYWAPANALFVKEFGIRYLPHAYIASGVIGYMVGWLYSRLQRRLKLSTLFTGTLIFLLLLISTILIGFHWIHGKAMVFVMFSWAATVVSLIYLEFGGLMISLFNLRQGKRLFGLVNSGDIVSSIISYLSIPLLIPLLHNVTDLLYLSFAGVLGSLILLLIIRKKFTAQLSVSRKRGSTQPSSFLALLKERYFVLIFGIAVFSMMGVYFTDYSYLSVMRIRFETKEELTQFIGIFFAMIKCTELTMSLISGRLLKQYGLRLGLAMLPVMLVAIIAAAALFGTFFGAESSSFFILIAFSKLMERAVRKAIDGPSIRTLYQPLPPEQQLDIQAKVEGIVNHLGIVVAGLAMLAFTFIRGSSLLIYFSYFYVFALLAWSKLAFTIYNYYRDMVRKLLARRNLEVADGQSQAMSTLDILSGLLQSNSVPKVLYGLNILESIAPSQILPSIRRILQQASASVRKEVLNTIRERKTIAALSAVSASLEREEAEDVRVAADGAFRALQETKEISFDQLAILVISPDPRQREAAVKLLGDSSRFQSFRLLQRLLEDDVPPVRKAAIYAAAKSKRPELWSFIIDNLHSPAHVHTASSALVTIGAPVIGDLERHFGRMGQARAILLHIIKIYRRIGGVKALKLLRNRMHYHDKEVRYEIISALGEMNYHADESEAVLLKQSLEEEVGSVIWTMASLRDVAGEPRAAELMAALEYELKTKKERVFLILSMLYDPQTIGFVREHIRSASNETRVYALEIIDLTVSSDIKPLLLPLLEDLPLTECIQTFRLQFPEEDLSCIQRVKEIIYKDHATVNRWTRTCALTLLRECSAMEYSDVLVANIANSDPLLAETAAYSLYSLDPDRFHGSFVAVPAAVRRSFEQTIRNIAEGKRLSLFDRILLLQSCTWFSNVPAVELCEVALLMEEVPYASGASLPVSDHLHQYFALVTDGQLIADGKDTVYRRGSVIVQTGGHDSGTIIALEDTRLLRMDIQTLYEMIAENVRIAQVFIRAGERQYAGQHVL